MSAPTHMPSLASNVMRPLFSAASLPLPFSSSDLAPPALKTSSRHSQPKRAAALKFSGRSERIPSTSSEAWAKVSSIAAAAFCLDLSSSICNLWMRCSFHQLTAISSTNIRCMVPDGRKSRSNSCNIFSNSVFSSSLAKIIVLVSSPCLIALCLTAFFAEVLRGPVDFWAFLSFAARTAAVAVFFIVSSG